jgi:hypothetical protein
MAIATDRYGATAADRYAAKKQRMFLESKLRKWYTELVYTVFWYIILILAYVIYRYTQLYLILFLLNHLP